MRAEALLDLKDIKRRDKSSRHRLHAVAANPHVAVGDGPVRRLKPLIVVMFLLLVVVAGCALLLKRYAAAFAIEHVVIEGEFHNEQAREIEQVLKPHMAGDLFTIDLPAARAALVNLEWVADVRLQRAWPDKVIVRIQEQVPVARWNKNKLVNDAGVIFDKAYGADIDALPLLAGPDNRVVDVLDRFAWLQGKLAQNNMHLTELQVDARNSWSLRTREGVFIQLGSHDVEARLSRLLSVMKSNQKIDWSGVSSFDLRHSNGFAASWTTERPHEQG